MKRLVQGIPSENDGALDSLVLCEPEPKAFYQFEERESTVFRRYGQDCRVHLTLPIDDIRIICRKMNLFEKFCVLRAVDGACFLPPELVRHITQLLFRQFVYCQFCKDFIGETLHVCMRCGDSPLICVLRASIVARIVAISHAIAYLSVRWIPATAVARDSAHNAPYCVPCDVVSAKSITLPAKTVKFSTERWNLSQMIGMHAMNTMAPFVCAVGRGVHWSCHAVVHWSCRAVVHWSCRALVVSCIVSGRVVHWSCRALVVSCIGRVVHWSCRVVHWSCRALCRALVVS